MQKNDSTLIAATLPTDRLLIDTGAGSSSFIKGFDPHAQKDTRRSGKLATVTGESLTGGDHLKSVIQFDDGRQFGVEYDESDSIRFNVLFAGQALDKGIWTLVGPNSQLMIQDRFVPNSVKSEK